MIRFLNKALALLFIFLLFGCESSPILDVEDQIDSVTEKAMLPLRFFENIFSMEKRIIHYF